MRTVSVIWKRQTKHPETGGNFRVKKQIGRYIDIKRNGINSCDLVYLITHVEFSMNNEGFLGPTWGHSRLNVKCDCTVFVIGNQIGWLSEMSVYLPF